MYVACADNSKSLQVGHQRKDLASFSHTFGSFDGAGCTDHFKVRPSEELILVWSVHFGHVHPSSTHQ